MVSYENFYGGGNYSLSSDYGELYLGIETKYPSSTFGIPTDIRTANQLDAVSKKIFTGAKTIEVSGVQAGTFESLPDQHLEEIDRLRKLTGVDLTFHGPVLEPTGITKEGWDESHRVMAERQMWSSVDRAQKIDPNGNVVMTFHASAVNLEPEVKVFNKDTGEWETKEIAVINNEGRFNRFKLTPDYFTGEMSTPKAELDKQNADAWFRELQNANFHAYAGMNDYKRALTEMKQTRIIKDSSGKDVTEQGLQELYGQYVKGTAEKNLAKLPKETKEVVTRVMQDFTHGDIYLRDSYQALQNLYNLAYEQAKKDNRESDLDKLKEFRKEIAPKLNYLQDPGKIKEFGQEIINGINVLRRISPPQRVRPLKDFMIDKSGETFGNVAYNAYKKYKNNSPIISIENPPAGTGIYRAEDMEDMIKKSKKVFVDRAISELGLNEKEAQKQADKLIGATWDVGHINMLRKYGASKQQLLEQTKKIAPYVKHIHLSDNFGMGHTELPMGMGNVPIKEEMEILEKYGKKIKELKKVAETGNWYGPQAFGNLTPLSQTLSAFGSPVYSMKMGPYWNQVENMSGGYFAGRGMNPDVHHSYFGAGYTTLPIELGGQMVGQSRLSGTPNQ
ncbi:hypothetical protein COU62_01080 [Candidatus Pacearchaeota archaeon CG10_big_fil_rev_8_21_14_0_10_35_219]|nr:sugar phosphate isomerase/epimerase [Candidatus Pacearchaeota archaeon]OIO43031.1 MAG: hypothetical protein AUJ63_01250 [Candidatus Pacearchaeota archaeon CG1_02_35_32]PIO08157.1 MAG: hypothetical protein COU62_01080 [Candidatus Pacearchaeota archaeon CG10_big_fil_rev_8_21_14_0_10_35_219]PIY81090.1 MAG: hypothetical protein COY79_04795 [Candidatus Pacearchaeota archaeon CG_4_10_14_0_8_um_filter_35_169]PIZ80337.1 MAG: hypothetical protein COY00_01530 [Candidatus Pacearchaeota archaeon CG_4_10